MWVSKFLNWQKPELLYLLQLYQLFKKVEKNNSCSETEAKEELEMKMIRKLIRRVEN